MEEPSMKRFAPLALIVLALAVVPVALADGTDPSGSTPTGSTSSQNAPAQAGGGVKLRIDVLRLRLQIVQLRFQVHCGPNGKASQDRCVAFAQKVETRLMTLDGNVQQKIADLKNCTSDSTDQKCKNADKKIDVLTQVDTHLQAAIQKVQNWLSGKGSSSDPTTPPSSSDGALDQAAGALSQAAGSNG
jgi:hypothetical protein